MLGVQSTVAVSQATDEGASRLLAENVTVGLAPLAHRSFDDRRKTLGDVPKEVMTSIDNFAGSVSMRRGARDIRFNLGRSCRRSLLRAHRGCHEKASQEHGGRGERESKVLRAAHFAGLCPS